MTTFINENITATVSAAPISTPVTAAKSAVTVKSAMKQIEKLVSDKTNWEQTAYKNSNDLLYSLLQRCYIYYITMCEDSEDGKAARDALNAYVKKHNFGLKKSTHNIAKILKCVFGDNRRRVSAYSIALRNAYAEKVNASDIAQYITEQGGVEEFRLMKSSTFIKPKEKAERAAVVASSATLGAVKTPELCQMLDPSKVGQQLLAIVTQAADGSLTINALIENQSALNAALVSYYSRTKKTAVETAKTAVAKQPQQNAADAVDAAVQKLAA